MDKNKLITRVDGAYFDYVLCYCKSSSIFSVLRVKDNHEFEETGYYSDDILEAEKLLINVAENENKYLHIKYCYSTLYEIDYYCNFGLEWTLLNRG